MTSALTLPRGLRHPSWFTLVLVPVVPLLGRLSNASYPLFSDDGTLILPLLLLVFGIALALGLPETIEQSGRRVRKETELLRSAWLASVFLVQSTILGGQEVQGLGLVLFAASCALLSAIPFGAEFQQRTLAGLLSQPLPRQDWWHIKTLTLGAALLLHAALYLLSLATAGYSVSLELALATLVIAFVAWGSTPWWTLLSRGLLAGLVFSIAVPLLALATLVLASEQLTALAGYLPLQFRDRIPLPVDQVWAYLLLFVVGPVYAAIARRLGRRRWLTLEAPDAFAGEAGILQLPTFRSRAATGSARTSIVGHLVAKEFRVQTATLAIGAAAAILVLVSFVPTEGLSPNRDFLRGGIVLIAATTILLAGAMSIAEERRLGTLDAQLLLPISRSRQWWIKLGVALLLAGVAGVLLRLGASGRISSGEYLMETLIGGGICLCLFATATLASSASHNSLRALLAAVVLSGVALALTQTGYKLVSEANEAGDVWVQMQDLETAAPWRARAVALGHDAIMSRVNLSQSMQLDRPPVALGFTFLGLPLLAALLALHFARRNFIRPGVTPRRIALQFAACFASLVPIFAAQYATVRTVAVFREETTVLEAFDAHIRWEAQLSPAEVLLRKRHPADPPNALSRSLRMPRSCPVQIVALPLSPNDRDLVLEYLELPENLRALLQQEAAQDPRPRKPRAETAPPKPTPPAMAAPAPNFQMDPAMMRRYGLLPKTNAPRPATPVPQE